MSDYMILRFLFGPESDQYIKQSKGNITIASTCLKYLCSDCFEPELSDQEITGAILRGAYVLQEYAVSHWLEHVIRGLSNSIEPPSLEQISCDIEAMVELRKNHDFEILPTGYVAHPSLRIFEAKTPEVFKALTAIHSFLQKRWSEYSLADGKVLCPPPAMHALTQEWHRRPVGRSRPFDNLCNAATSPSTLRSGALLNVESSTGLQVFYNQALLRTTAF